MVNENFEEFSKEQKKHQSSYLGGSKRGDFNKTDYNSQENTDKAVGATGRKRTLKS